MDDKARNHWYGTEVSISEVSSLIYRRRTTVSNAENKDRRIEIHGRSSNPRREQDGTRTLVTGFPRVTPRRVTWDNAVLSYRKYSKILNDNFTIIHHCILAVCAPWGKWDTVRALQASLCGKLSRVSTSPQKVVTQKTCDKVYVPVDRAS